MVGSFMNDKLKLMANRFWHGKLHHFLTTPNMKGQDIPLYPASTLWPLWRDGPYTSSYATVGMALRVFGTHKPPHHDKVGQSVKIFYVWSRNRQ